MSSRSRSVLTFAALFLLGAALSFLLLRLESCLSLPLPSESGPLGPASSFQGAARIICATPGITDIVFSLGAGDRVVGVSQFSTNPQAADSKADIGGLINPNRERILALRPDLFITQGRHDSMARFCREHGIRFLTVRIETMEDIWNAIRFLGRELGLEDRARQLVGELQDELGEIRHRLESLPRKKVFLTLGHTPGDLSNLMTTGSGTFLDQVITAAGGRNIYSDAAGFYPQIAKESLIARSPDVVIEVFTGRLSGEQIEMLRRDWENLPMLPAVRTDSIHFLNDDFLLVPGTRITRTVRKLAEILHPGEFDESRHP